MLSVVYFEGDGRNIMVAVFLMRSDAEFFIKNTLFSEGYKIADVDGHWADWSKIKEGIKA